MSSVSRSVYQKVCEENKMLKKQIRLLISTNPETGLEQIHLRIKLRKIEAERVEFNEFLKLSAKEYIKYHREELPDFLTNNKSNERNNI